MRQTQALRWKHLPRIAAGVVALALAGCSGDDGKQGPPGPPGPGAFPPTSEAAALNLTITSVSINSAPVVQFTATNQHGVPVSGLTTSNLAFTIAKLVPGSDGNPSRWQNYIVTTRRPASAPDRAEGRFKARVTRPARW